MANIRCVECRKSLKNIVECRFSFLVDVDLYLSKKILKFCCRCRINCPIVFFVKCREIAIGGNQRKEGGEKENSGSKNSGQRKN